MLDKRGVHKYTGKPLFYKYSFCNSNKPCCNKYFNYSDSIVFKENYGGGKGRVKGNYDRDK